jgi:hypothetical protein
LDEKIMDIKIFSKDKNREIVDAWESVFLN